MCVRALWFVHYRVGEKRPAGRPPALNRHNLLSTTNSVLSASLNAEDDEGRTPLIEAREQGQPGALLALVQVI